jgi:uncharacterized membrane protein
MKNWKAIVGVVAVFLFGMVAGGLVTAKIFQYRIYGVLRSGSPAAANVVVRRLSWQLRLDAAQREQVRQIVGDAQQEMKAVRKQVHPQVEEILDRADGKVRAILRPEQTGKFDKLVAERKARWVDK